MYKLNDYETDIFRKFMKKILIAVLILSLSGCGWFDRAAAHYTGKGSEVCQDGVVYLQFTSGSSVKYKPDGKVATC